MENINELAAYAIATMDEKSRADFIKLVDMGRGDLAHQIVMANVQRYDVSVQTMVGMYRTMPAIKDAFDAAVIDSIS